MLFSYGRAKPIVGAQVGMDDASAVRVPFGTEAQRYHEADVNGVIGTRDPQELAALTRLLKFLDIETLKSEHGPLPLHGTRATVDAMLDRFFPKEATQLPYFGEAREQLAQDLLAVTEQLCAISHSDQVGFSLLVHHGMPRIGGLHQDRAPCVSITTYRGVGTELASNSDVVDWSAQDSRGVFADRAVREDSLQRAETGDRVLLKGQRHPHCFSFDERRFPHTASVHRSPNRPRRIVALAYSNS